MNMKLTLARSKVNSIPLHIKLRNELLHQGQRRTSTNRKEGGNLVNSPLRETIVT